MSSCKYRNSHYKDKFDGLVQERRNSSALAMELRLSCTNPLRWSNPHYKDKVGKPHYTDKMVCRPSHLYDSNPYTSKTASLYWISPHVYLAEATCPTLATRHNYHMILCMVVSRQKSIDLTDSVHYIDSMMYFYWDQTIVAHWNTSSEI